jgi:glycine cleavage system regulatory protein
VEESLMSVHLVLTVIARDKPGVVEALSQTVSDHGANWLGSRMARLGGEFAGIVEVSAPAANAASLRVALDGLESHGLRVQIQQSTRVDAAGGRSTSLRLELVGNDRPGIVREISQALARRGVNVDELATGCESAAMSGDLLFRATARLDVPSDVTIDSLGEELEKIAADLMVDLTLDEPESR